MPSKVGRWLENEQFNELIATKAGYGIGLGVNTELVQFSVPQNRSIPYDKPAAC